ncbi:MAG: hypothetical protein KDC18_19775 [Alphaproteobacteria bacterium]|nr:hypothetical protein [Alphaproteobacteria bacterium]MCB9930970.1 hypothetical protein [Alphaproteobacteria bacterium]
MTSPSASPSDPALLAALAPLGAIDPADRAIAPPHRRPLDERRECLVIWQPDSEGGDWSLVVYARPVDPTDTATPVARLALHLPASQDRASVHWEDADPAFRAWAAAELPAIARDLAAGQPAELARLRARARINTNVAGKLSGLLPHAVVLGGLAAFAYMFGIVNIH